MVALKQHRKCDTAKYKRRRRKEAEAHKIRVARRQREEAETHRILRERHERYEREQRELRVARRRLVQVLANRLYKLSPEHASRARVRELFMVMESIIGKDTITRNLLGEAFARRRQRYEQKGSPRVVENSSGD